MKFRNELNGIALAAIVGTWASVTIGQGQGPGIEDLLLTGSAPSAPAAAKPAENTATPKKEVAAPVAKPAEKAPEPVAAKPTTNGKYKIAKEEKPVAPVQKDETKPAEKSPEPVAAKPTTNGKYKIAKEEKPVAPVQKDETKPAEKAPEPVAAKPATNGKYKIAKEEKPVAPVQKDETKPAEKPVAAAVPAADEDTDEINLNEIDDSAVAAKGRPVVKLAAPQAPAAPAAAEKPSADGSAAAKAPAAPATGSEIAARFLASDETALVDITSDNASLTDILRQFRRATGANIIYAESSNLQQRVSVSLQHVPWLQGMKSILNSRGFRVESSGGIHFVKEDKLAEPIFTRTFQLNHASVDELSKLFNESYGTKGKDGKMIKSVATPFQGANTIVVTASEHVLADCEAIIKAVDKAVPQIYIEARFVELTTEAMHKLGIQWNQLESWGASVKDLEGGMGYANGRAGVYRNGHTDKYYTPKDMTQSGSSSSASASEDSSISDTSASRKSDSASSSSTTFTDLASGRSVFDYRQKDYLRQANELAADSPMAWRNSRMFSGQLSADDFRLAMSAFEQLQDTKVFSNPKVIVSNGKEALFDRTTKYPNVTITSQHDTQSGYTSSDTRLEVIPGDDELFSKKKTAFFSWGITLTVKPRISPDGLISVEIVPNISELQFDTKEGGTASGFYQIYGGSDSPYGRYPIILFKRLTTEFTMKDGATAVIGGLSKTEEGDIDSGIPYLRKIPWIGPKLFGWKSRGKVQKEILIFVTIGIADPANLPEDIGLPKNAVRGREYVEKRAFEPGDRPNAANDILKLDMDPLDDRRPVEAKKSTDDVKVEAAKSETPTEPRGTVTITPVVTRKE